MAAAAHCREFVTRSDQGVLGLMSDTSDQAVTPALGYAANMITVCVVVFLGLVAFIFWLGGLAERTVSESKPPPLARQTQPAARME